MKLSTAWLEKVEESLSMGGTTERKSPASNKSKVSFCECFVFELLSSEESPNLNLEGDK